MDCSITGKWVATTIEKIIFSEFEIDSSNFTFLISDAAWYITKAGNILKNKIKNLFHITCIEHLLQNCALKIKEHFKSVDYLISSMKFALLKSKDRQMLFDDLKLQPKTVVTRWRSWMTACKYYSENLPQIRSIVASFKDDGKITQNVKNAVTM